MSHKSIRLHSLISLYQPNLRLPAILNSGFCRSVAAGITFALCTGIALSNHDLLGARAASAQPYRPQTITSSKPIIDILSDKDLPTGEKGFARDYLIQLKSNERVEITVSSEQFDTVVRLLDSKGEEMVANDDANKETTNSLIYYKVPRSGTYTVRVQSFGGSSGGRFTLRVERLRPVTE